MAYYSESLIDDILSTLDIVQVINEYVPLKRRGVNYIGLCPFHKEKTPSFTVSPDKQIYKCFGCSEGGTVIQFISKMENLDFVETLEYLAEKARLDTKGYEIKTSRRTETKEQRNQKETIYEINKEAAKYFYEALEEEVRNENSILKDYLIKRKLDMNIIRKFGIGYGTRKNETLEKRLVSLGFNIIDILLSGLLNKNISEQIYSPFSSRIIFPILDTRDRVIGFGGRVLDNSLPKYVNSPENTVYHKGRNLYALSLAKRETLNQILIVEGYMDVISLQKAGINFAVATLGTALTENQAKLLKKYTSTVILGYDQDAAGQAAILRGIDILRNEGLKVKVLKLDKEDIKDPDEYINKYGKERLIKCIENSISSVEFKIDSYYKNKNLSVFDEKVEFLTNVAVVLSDIENNIEREMYVDKISNMYSISKNAITGEIDKRLNKTNNANMYSNYFNHDIQNRIDGSKILRQRQEQYIISLLLSKDRKIIDKVFNTIKQDEFEYKNISELYDDLKKLNIEKDITKLNIVSKITDEKKLNLITEIMCIDISKFNKNKLLEDILQSFKKYKFQKRREEILKKLKENITKEEKDCLDIELSQIILKLKK